MPLADQLGPVPERLRRYPLDGLAVGRRLDYQVGAELEAGRRELQRVLPLRPASTPSCAGLVPAFKRGGAGPRLGARASRTARAPGPSPPPGTQRPGAVPRPGRGRAHPPQGRARLPQPDAQPVRRPRRRLHPVAARAGPRPRSSASCCSTPTSRPGPASTPPTRPSSGTWSTARTGPCARASSGACPRAPTPAAGSPPWRSRASTSAATSSTAWERPRSRGPPATGRGRRHGRAHCRRRWDVVVVGLGALGSAAAWALARAGAGCWGWSSSSSGTTGGRRTTTPASSAAPTTRPATCAWPAWPTTPGPSWSGRRASGWWSTTGGLDLFPAGSAIPPGPYRASLEACGVPYQWLDAAEVMRRWPAFRARRRRPRPLAGRRRHRPGRPRHPAACSAWPPATAPPCSTRPR